MEQSKGQWMGRRVHAGLVLGVCLLTRVGVAQDGGGAPAVDAATLPAVTETGAAADDGLRFDLRLGVWLPRLGGDSKFDKLPGAGNISLEDQLDLDATEVTPNAELTMRFGEGFARLAGFAFSTDRSGVYTGGADTWGSLRLAEGDPFKASVDMASVAIEGGFDLFHPFGAGRRWDSPTTDLAFGLMGGLRYVDVDQHLEVPGQGKNGADSQWFALYGGIEMNLRWGPEDGLVIGRALSVDVNVAAGSQVDSLGLMTQVRADLTLEVITGVGITFGYRLLEVDFNDGDFEFDGGLQGLFLGANIRF